MRFGRKSTKRGKYVTTIRTGTQQTAMNHSVGLIIWSIGVLESRPER